MTAPPCPAIRTHTRKWRAATAAAAAVLCCSARNGACSMLGVSCCWRCPVLGSSGRAAVARRWLQRSLAPPTHRRCAGLHLCAQQVASRDVVPAILLDDQLTLRALSRPLCCCGTRAQRSGGSSASPHHPGCVARGVHATGRTWLAGSHTASTPTRGLPAQRPAASQPPSLRCGWRGAVGALDGFSRSCWCVARPGGVQEQNSSHT
jgi:hypothetical protein